MKSSDLKPPLEGYSIWLMLSDDKHTQMQPLIEKLDHLANSRRFEAHATLIGLLDYTSDNKERLMNGTQALANSTSAITTELTGVGFRNSYFQSVFLHMMPTKQLVELNIAARLLFGHQTDPVFMPHASMVYGDFNWELKQKLLQEITKKMSFPDTITFDRLALVRVDGYPEEWEVESEFSFNG